MGERWDLNPRPSVPQTDALPAELRSPQVEEERLMLISAFATYPRSYPKANGDELASAAS
jgi:hypothetical protein